MSKKKQLDVPNKKICRVGTSKVENHCFTTFLYSDGTVGPTPKIQWVANSTYQIRSHKVQ